MVIKQGLRAATAALGGSGLCGRTRGALGGELPLRLGQASHRPLRPLEARPGARLLPLHRPGGGGLGLGRTRPLPGRARAPGGGSSRPRPRCQGGC